MDRGRSVFLRCFVEGSVSMVTVLVVAVSLVIALVIVAYSAFVLFCDGVIG